jgi:hypothetical protein
VDDNEKGNKDEGSSGEDTDEAHIILQVMSVSKTARTNTERTRITSKWLRIVSLHRGSGKCIFNSMKLLP